MTLKKKINLIVEQFPILKKKNKRENILDLKSSLIFILYLAHSNIFFSIGQ